VLGGSIKKELDAIDADETMSETEKGFKRDRLKTEWQKLHDQVLEAGGLHIIGTERHESRRVDNQLRGRSGRQGDPGSSRFYLSLEDPLLRIFASDRVAAIMNRLKLPEGEAIEHPWVSRAIENAQRKVEARNFDIRKQLLEYDDVANDQRKVIYQERNELLAAENIADTIQAMRADVVNSVIDQHINPGSMEEQWDVEAAEKSLQSEFGLEVPLQQWLKEDEKLDEQGLREKAVAAANEVYAAKEAIVGPDVLRHFERAIMLQSLDSHWREHLAALDHLRQGIHLRGYAQKNPKQEYKREAFQLFSNMLDAVKLEVTRITATVQVRSEQDVQAAEQQHEQVSNVQYHHADADEALAGSDRSLEESSSSQPVTRDTPKVGRNDPCPCGSGKKYKHCHGKLS